jgi:hypothetical protein
MTTTQANIIGYLVYDLSTCTSVGEPFPVGSDRLAARDAAILEARRRNRAQQTTRYTFKPLHA